MSDLMPVDRDDINAAKDILWQDEKPEITAKQRRIGPGGSVINPTSVVATDKRIIIVNRATLGIRKDYEVIPYRQITSVRLEKGIISSSVFIRVQGYDKDKGLLEKGKEEGEIDGLNGRDAKLLADYINQRISGEAPESEVSEEPDREPGAYRYCNKCGTKNSADAKYCSSCGARLED